MYRVRIQQFEGPLDLLLFFLRRDELDVYDIPIARIADEFLDYVKLLEQIDLDGVGDFLYMAAQLIQIKARMLLPSPEVDEDGEPIDPRQELVERLLAYIQFKEAAESMTELQDQRALLFNRGEAAAPELEQAPPDEGIQASIFDLVTALRRVLTKAPEAVVHAVAREEYSVEEQQDFVVEMLSASGKMGFGKMMDERTKPFVIATFLAILELARLGQIVILMMGTPEDFMLELAEEPAPSASHGHPVTGTPSQANG